MSASDDLASVRAQLVAAHAHVAELERWRDEAAGSFMALRLVTPDNACSWCGGWGYRSYGSTATWHGGIGGCAMTTDVCDHCWGSGRLDVTWPSHRESRIVTCVYCGAAYPAGTPTHGAEVLTAHVRVCPKHPMRAVEQELQRLRVVLGEIRDNRATAALKVMAEADKP